MAAPLPTARTNPFDPPEELRADDRGIRRFTLPDGSLGWLITSHPLAKSVLADSGFSSKMELRKQVVARGETRDKETGKPPVDGMFIAMDPPEHTRFRRQLTGQFTVRRMNQLQPRIQQIVDEHLEAMAASGPPADLVAAFALPVPSLVICELLGVPYADRADFQRNSATALRLGVSDEEALAAVQSLAGFLAGLIERKRREPTDDLLSGLIENGELTDRELIGVSMVLLVAGHETTANMLSLGTLALLRHPEQADALRASETSVDVAVEELLRYLSVIQFGTTRVATYETELGGEGIAVGDQVLLSIPAANRDSGQFAEPDQLNLAGQTQGHLAFGHGVHQCLGQQLARIEMRIGYTTLLRRFPTLRLAVPVADIPLRTDMTIYGVHELPVSW
ncbi:cytochrome P450 [Tamaricihabitans halophyticus]|uniref:Cytochrome P450 n=1 Tax=Tamaricihabitans halophyticus TaxID=1262583 RepID=A0A4R2QNJ4_9PSEU|nr:cytochrome P450 [Tamaricihabitans halophyticus]TCP48635.1 cytochrome P450 [Tamaricihabitans halophyticus]